MKPSDANLSINQNLQPLQIINPDKNNNQNLELQSPKESQIKSLKLALIIISILLSVSIALNIALPIVIANDDDDNSNSETFHKYNFKYWTKDSKVLDSLVSYVKDVVNKESKNYIPIEDRISAFDMDGTLVCETSPTYLAYWHYYLFVMDNDKLHSEGKDTPEIKSSDYDFDYQKTTAETLMKLIKGEDAGTDWDTFEVPQMQAEAAAFKGYTLDEYLEHVNQFLELDAANFTNAKNKDLYYKPMKEIIEFLQNNNFKTYINSGTDRLFCRAFAKILGIPMDNVIGTDMEFMADNENKTAGTLLDDKAKTFGHDNKVIKSGDLYYYNYRMGKVRTNAKEIGIIPVLNFGNSGGDTSMNNYAISKGNKYKAKAFMIVADDIDREYGIDKYVDGKLDTTKSDAKKAQWTSADNQFEVISMRDDFKTIYGEDVEINKN